MANVSGCTLPPNGDPAAGAAGTAPGSQHPPGINATLEQGTGCPQAPLARAVGCQDASSLPALQECSVTPGKPPQIPWDSQPGGFAGDTGSPSLPFPHQCQRCQRPAWHCSHPGGDESLPPLPILLPPSSQIAKASNLPAGKAEGKEPLFCCNKPSRQRRDEPFRAGKGEGSGPTPEPCQGLGETRDSLPVGAASAEDTHTGWDTHPGMTPA